MRILVVDDLEVRHDYFKKIYNSIDDIIIQSYDYDNAILEISSTPHAFDLMFLDHDLSGGSFFHDPATTLEKTGSDIAEYIARVVDPTKCPGLHIICHSMNPLGRVNMVNILEKAGFRVTNSPFSHLLAV